MIYVRKKHTVRSNSRHKLRCKNISSFHPGYNSLCWRIRWKKNEKCNEFHWMYVQCAHRTMFAIDRFQLRRKLSRTFFLFITIWKFELLLKMTTLFLLRRLSRNSKHPKRNFWFFCDREVDGWRARANQNTKYEVIYHFHFAICEIVLHCDSTKEKCEAKMIVFHIANDEWINSVHILVHIWRKRKSKKKKSWKILVFETYNIA